MMGSVIDFHIPETATVVHPGDSSDFEGSQPTTPLEIARAGLSRSFRDVEIDGGPLASIDAKRERRASILEMPDIRDAAHIADRATFFESLETAIPMGPSPILFESWVDSKRIAMNSPEGSRVQFPGFEKGRPVRDPPSAP